MTPWQETAALRDFRPGNDRCESPVPAFSPAQYFAAHARRLRLDPNQFARHSLRAGFLTSAAIGDVTLPSS
jgi:hypothetical protein